MIRTGYHATNNLAGILSDGKVLPKRLFNVYLTDTEESARLYAKHFGCSDIVAVHYDTMDIESVWRPAYLDKGRVIKLRRGRCARVITEDN